MYVSVAKRKVLECLELDSETAGLLTSNDRETNLHAVPLWSVTLKSMARLLKHYRGRYTTVVGFQPTGWTQKQGSHAFIAWLLQNLLFCFVLYLLSESMMPACINRNL